MRRFLVVMCWVFALAACGAHSPGPAPDAERSAAADRDTAVSSPNAGGETVGHGFDERSKNEEEHRDAETRANDAATATEAMANAVAATTDAADAAGALAEAMIGSIPEVERQRREQELRARNSVVLSVLVRDRRSKRPIVGAIVEGSKSTRPSIVVRRERTDASGRYEEYGATSDEYTAIVVRCPTRLDPARTPKIGESAFVARGGRVETAIEVDSRICADPPITKRFGRYSGVYILGLEDSIFFPCSDMPSEASYYEFPRGYWIVTTPTIRNRLLRAIPTTPDKWHPRGLYVEWLGTSTGPGNYGHMADALYRLEVEALYKVSTNIPASCRPSGLREFFAASLPAPSIRPRFA